MRQHGEPQLSVRLNGKRRISSESAQLATKVGSYLEFIGARAVNRIFDEDKETALSNFRLQKSRHWTTLAGRYAR